MVSHRRRRNYRTNLIIKFSDRTRTYIAKFRCATLQMNTGFTLNRDPGTIVTLSSFTWMLNVSNSYRPFRLIIPSNSKKIIVPEIFNRIIKTKFNPWWERSWTESETKKRWFLQKYYGMFVDHRIANTITRFGSNWYRLYSTSLMRLILQ